MTLDATELRRDFPVLGRTVNDRPLVYLDSAASSQKPRQVVEAMSDYYYRSHANVHRGAHVLSVEATSAYEEARAKVASFVGGEVEGLVFVRNATEAVNLAAQSWGRANLGPGDEILVSVAEHHANIVPWQMVAAERGARVVPVGLNEAGTVDLDELRRVSSRATKVIAVFHVSNVLGTQNPIADVVEVARGVGAMVLVDGAQAAPHLPVDVSALGCDMYAFSSHKMLGPTGIGALWARPELLAAMPPFMGGGEMISRVSFEGTTYAAAPKRFEAGTPSIAEAVGFAAAVDYLSEIGMEEVRRHDALLVDRAVERLAGVEGVELVGPREGRHGLVTFTVEGVHAHDIASALDLYGVAVRAGQHCAQPLHRSLGIVASTRASFYVYNEAAEVDTFADALSEAATYLRGVA